MFYVSRGVDHRQFLHEYITDKPSVRIARVNSPVLEEGSGSVSLTCISESNPPAQVMWSKVEENSSPQYKEMLEFTPVTRKQAGTYICQAENSVGRSDEERADVDILCKLICTPIIALNT